jgi:hypothetical protein
MSHIEYLSETACRGYHVDTKGIMCHMSYKTYNFEDTLKPCIALKL